MNFSHEKNPGKNFTGIAIVVLLHVLVAWAVINGLGTRIVTKVTEAVETKLIEDVKPPPPPETPPPPPPPEMKAPPPPFVPPVEVQVQQPPPPQNTMAAATNTPPPSRDLAAPAPPAPPAPAAKPFTGPAKTAAVVDFSTCSTPEYPKSSQRNEETGISTILFRIGADGSVKESSIQKSSGFRDLDRAALTALSKCRFKPGTENGQAVESMQAVRYEWKLD